MKGGLVALLLAVVAGLATSEFTAPTADEITTMKTDIKSLLESNTVIQPTTLRLAFHDCVGGTCDGCINLDNDSNAGLTTVIETLDTLYVGTYDSVISRADFWQLSAIVEIEIGITLNNRLCTETDCSLPDHSIVFKWGRDDCATSPSTTDVHTFPEPTMSRTEMMTYYDTNFGFTEDEVTALMGAHSLGGAQLANSGYAGIWVVGERRRFNNNFYSLLVDSSVTYLNSQKKASSTTDNKWQFDMLDSTSSQIGFMLNTDVELVYDIDVSATAGTSCTIGTDCAVADTYSLVASYAADGTTWLTDFSSVYQKMIDTGYTDLQEV